MVVVVGIMWKQDVAEEEVVEVHMVAAARSEDVTRAGWGCGRVAAAQAVRVQRGEAAGGLALRQDNRPRQQIRAHDGARAITGRCPRC